jgi:hypothetical protein
MTLVLMPADACLLHAHAHVQVHQAMPVALPLELRVASLADPFAHHTVLLQAADLVQGVRDNMREGRPDDDAVHPYREFVGAVMGLYNRPQTVHKVVWVALLAHRHSQHFVDMLACWLSEMDVQQHIVAGDSVATANTAGGSVSGGSDAAASASTGDSESASVSADAGASSGDASADGSASASNGVDADAASEPALEPAPAPAGSYSSLFVSKMSELRRRWAGDIDAARAAAGAASLRGLGRGRTSEVMERVVASHGHGRALHATKQPVIEDTVKQGEGVGERRGGRM